MIGISDRVVAPRPVLAGQSAEAGVGETIGVVRIGTIINVMHGVGDAMEGVIRVSAIVRETRVYVLKGQASTVAVSESRIDRTGDVCDPIQVIVKVMEHRVLVGIDLVNDLAIGVVRPFVGLFQRVNKLEQIAGCVVGELGSGSVGSGRSHLNI